MSPRMNMQSGRKHKSKLDIWENQWSGSLAAPLIFCYPLAKYFEMSEDCNISACYFVEIKTTSDISVTFMFYNGVVNKEKTFCPAAEKKKTAAGQTDFPCLYFVPCGGFKRLKPPFFYPPKE